MFRWWPALIVAFWLVCPAWAREEPFGQETIEVRAWRNPPRPEARPKHRYEHPKGHKHSPGYANSHTGRHSHHRSPPPQQHSHRHGDGNGHEHKHQAIETEHLFGFTKGSDIDPPGVQHFIADLSGRFSKQTGSYTALSKHLEYAFTPWRDFHVGVGASFSAHDIWGVPSLDDRRQVAFEGLSLEFRQRLLDRAKAPFGLTLTAEPHWARLDEVDGHRADKFALEVSLAADQELIKDRLYAAFNLIYEPEWVRLKATGETERQSTLGVSLAGMAAVAPSIFVGGEVRYLRSYEGTALNSFAGEAFFVGPVLFVNVSDRLALVAAFSSQVAGRTARGSGSLDLENFERHRAKLKAVINF